MKWKYATLMYLTDTPSRSHSLRLPVPVIWVALIVLIAAVLDIGAGFVLYAKLLARTRQVNDLLTENLSLLQENEKLLRLEKNFKANSQMLMKLMDLAGIAAPAGATPADSAGRDSLVGAFLSNTDELIDLAKPLTEADIVDVVPNGLPASGRITRGFNPYDQNVSRRHFGVDISAREGTKVYATADGVVEFADWDDVFGKYVIIDHTGASGSRGFKTSYGHNMTLLVTKGEIVKKGDLIALTGNTGKSTGPHLHYEVRQNGVAVDPQEPRN